MLAEKLRSAAASEPPVPPYTFLGGVNASAVNTSTPSVALPSFAVPGSVLIIAIGSGVSGQSITPPSGFTELYFASSGWLASGGFWAKKLTSSDTGPFVFTFSGDTTSMSWVVGAFANCNIGTDRGGRATDSNTSFLPAVTPTQSGNMILMSKNRAGTAITATIPSTTVLYAPNSRGAFFDVGPVNASVTYGGWTVNQAERKIGTFLVLTP
jgi:hypothetical protein